MNLMAARLISVTVAIAMLGFLMTPLSFAGFYVILRPIVQPFGTLNYTFWGGLPLTSMFSIILIVFAFIDSLREENQMFPGNSPFLYIFCFLAVFSFYDTPSVLISFAHIVKIFTAVAMYLLIYNNIDSIEDLKKILTCYLLSAVAPLLYGFYQYITKTAHSWETGPGGTRIDSFLGQANAYGEFLSVIICVIIAAFFFQKLTYNKWLLIFLSGAVAVSFILSLNRGSWISLFIGIITASLWYRRHVKPLYIIAGSVVFITIALPILISRFNELAQSTEFGSKNTFTQRVEYWFILMDMVLKKFLIGYGIGTAGTTSLIDYAPHNDYLRLALETGVPTSMIYVWFLFKELLDHIKRINAKVFQIVHFSSFILLIYFMILSVFQNIVYNQVVFPMIMGLFALSARLHDLEEAENFLKEKQELEC